MGKRWMEGKLGLDFDRDVKGCLRGGGLTFFFIRIRAFPAPTRSLPLQFKFPTISENPFPQFPFSLYYSQSHISYSNLLPVSKLMAETIDGAQNEQEETTRTDGHFTGEFECETTTEKEIMNGKQLKNLHSQIGNQKNHTNVKPNFREKSYSARPPLLEKYFDLDNGKSVIFYDFCVAIFILATMGTLAQDFHWHGNLFYHLWLIKWNFEQFPQTMLLWTGMFISSIVFPFYGLKFWAHFGSAWSQFMPVVLYIFYQIAFFYWSLQTLFFMELKGACTFIITCESTRIAMKAHSFVRENFSLAKKIIERRQSSTNDKIQNVESAIVEEWPSLQQFIYFFFCPSLIFRISYPRSPSRSWRKVGQHFMGCMASIYFVNICFTQCIIPQFSPLDYTMDMDVNLSFLVTKIFSSIFPGAICLFAGIFYGLLHSWLSMFAEAMQFADRHFYSNWWSSRNMAEYYRNWNLVVHDWLYTYIYRDISQLFPQKWGFALAQTAVFFTSSVFHEYWFGIGLRMFYPVIFSVYFGFGGVFFLFSKVIKRPYVWNTLMWWNLLIGPGIFIVCYASEWYARQRCERMYENDFLDLIVPRIWNCNSTK